MGALFSSLVRNSICQFGQSKTRRFKPPAWRFAGRARLGLLQVSGKSEAWKRGNSERPRREHHCIPALAKSCAPGSLPRRYEPSHWNCHTPFTLCKRNGPGVKSTHWLHRPRCLLTTTLLMPSRTMPLSPPASRQDVGLKVTRPTHWKPFSLSDSVRSCGCTSSTVRTRYCRIKWSGAYAEPEAIAVVQPFGPAPRDPRSKVRRLRMVPQGRLNSSARSPLIRALSPRPIRRIGRNRPSYSRASSISEIARLLRIDMTATGQQPALRKNPRRSPDWRWNAPEPALRRRP